MDHDGPTEGLLENQARTSLKERITYFLRKKLSGLKTELRTWTQELQNLVTRSIGSRGLIDI